MSDWLKNLKVGDNVIVNSRHGDTLVKIERLTKTQIIIRNNYKFNRTTARVVGEDVWNQTYLEEATLIKITILKIAKEKLMLVAKIQKELNADELKSLSNTALSRILSMLQESHENN